MKQKRKDDVQPTVTAVWDYRNATGPVAIRMTNDYLFKVLLQKNEKVLHGLICSLLHLKQEEIRDIKIQNPIIPGDSISEKDIILDMKVIFNNAVIVDLEMQVVNEHNWTDRSLYYACRNYTNLEGGEAYEQTMPSVQIGLLNFTLFEEHPGFYTKFKLLEETKHYPYTDKLQIRVLDLTQIHLATEEDRAYNIDEWAMLFKAQTWEEIKMLASKNQEIDEAATTIYQISEDERIRQQCEAREDYIRRQNGMRRRMEKAEAIAAEEKEKTAKAEAIAAEERVKTAKAVAIAAEERAKKEKAEAIAAEEKAKTVKAEERAAKAEERAAEAATQLAEKDAVIEALMNEMQKLQNRG